MRGDCGVLWFFGLVYRLQSTPPRGGRPYPGISEVWLNDQVVWEDNRESAWDMGEALRKVTFQRGFNRIRIGNSPRPLIWSVLISPPEVLEYVEDSDG